MNRKNILCSIFVLALLFPFLIQAWEDIPELVKNVERSVVVIRTYNEKGNELSLGSGFFINQKGDIVTNWHVLAGAYKAEIKTSNGKSYPVLKVIAEDSAWDIIHVSVKISLSEVKHLSIITALPKVGERIIVIGSPLGLEKTVTDGIVSVIRDIPDFGRIIQISAPISPGSSGSPVVNMQGEVIGVASFQVVEGQNLNFAIPGERVLGLKTGKGKELSEIQKYFITTGEATQYVGEKKTVYGFVASTKYAPGSKGQPTFLNIDKPYPNQVFTVVIWGEDRHKFPQAPEKYYKGKNIFVTGQILIYRGIPEIIVSDPSQLSVVK